MQPAPAAWTAAAQSAPQTGAEAFILMDAGSGRVLTGKNTEQELAIASTTKIMTALVALETGKPFGQGDCKSRTT